MAELKTKPSGVSVDAFLDTIGNEQQRDDTKAIVKMMQKISGEKPAMWGPAIIGFGNVHLKYASGRELDWFKMGLSPRKANITLYISCDIKRNEDLLKKLGKHKTGAGCLYINKLTDVDETVLRELISRGCKRKQDQ